MKIKLIRPLSSTPSVDYKWAGTQILILNMNRVLSKMPLDAQRNCSKHPIRTFYEWAGNQMSSQINFAIKYFLILARFQESLSRIKTDFKDQKLVWEPDFISDQFCC